MSAVYFAAPLFTDAERAWNAGAVAALRRRLTGHEVLSPQEFCAAFDAGPGHGPDFARIYRACVEHLERAAAVLAVIDGPDPDSGTAWEAGFACARGIPVVALRTDWRPGEDGGGNCMLTRSCAHLARTLDDAAAALERALGARR
jgi:nucleoside 2-deoxyribosyltransferase